MKQRIILNQNPVSVEIRRWPRNHRLPISWGAGRSRAVSAVIALVLAAAAITLRGDTGRRDLTEMSPEELTRVEVTSVAKRPERLSETPAAISVVTQDDIRRSGASSIPEALRLVPGLDVAQVDAQEWAISSRGFNDPFANKLLVMIDGRSVYTPLFSGVFWDVQNTVMEDIDRIEVVRGPGATLWGANAVNGVINIITRNAKETQGVLVSAGGGNLEPGFVAIRYGDKLTDDLHFRVSGQFADHASLVLATGSRAHDSWVQGQGGFRMDWDASSENKVTFQGNAYSGLNDQTFTTYAPANPPGFTQTVQDRYSVSGGNLLGRFSHSFSAESQLDLQLYYDRTERHTAIIKDDEDVYDVDLQHRFELGSRNGVVWGLGYRATTDKAQNSTTVSLNPTSRTIQLFSAFVQDEIVIVPDRLRLTLGSKLEHNDFTGFEVQPGARLSWTPDKSQMIWGAVSRAVRTPSIAESDVTVNSVTTLPPGALFPGSPAIPVVTPFRGNPAFQSEELLAYELGYRAEPLKKLSLDVSLFYNDYDRLRSQERGAPNFLTVPPSIPVSVGNSLRGHTYGVELGPVWQVFDWWSLKPTYTYLKMRLRTDPGSTDTTSALQQEGQSPQHQFGLRSNMDLPHGLSLNCMLRYVDRLPAFAIPGYTELGVSLIWRASDKVEFAIVGQNLLHRNHPEFLPTEIQTQPTVVPRSVYAKVTCHF